MHDELEQRWTRMDHLNAGLEEAVQSKVNLETALQGADILLTKQAFGRLTWFSYVFMRLLALPIAF